MAQTPDGYLWLGTEFGLFRFDGVPVIPWQPPAGQHLPDAPYSLLVTRDGTLWIGTFAGLVSWNGGKLTSYPELGGQFVTSLLEDREGTVWAGTLGGPAPQAGSAQSEAAARNATGRMAPSAHSSGVWLRTVQALSGPAQSPVFGDGSPALQSDMRCRECGIGDLIPADDGRLIVGIRAQDSGRWLATNSNPIRFEAPSTECAACGP